MCENNTCNYSELIESGGIIEPKKEWNHSHQHLSACFSMKISMIFLGKVICSQSGLVHLVICRLKCLCCLTSKIAIAIARLGTRSNTFTARLGKWTPKRQAFFSLRFRSCSHWRIPLTWVNAKISVVRTMWSYFKSNLQVLPNEKTCLPVLVQGHVVAKMDYSNLFGEIGTSISNNLSNLSSE